MQNRGGDSFEPADRAQADVEIKFLPERYVQGPDPSADRCHEGALDPEMMSLEGLDCLAGEIGSEPFECCLSGLHFQPVEGFCSRIGFFEGGVQNAPHGGGHLGSDAVARDEGYLYFHDFMLFKADPALNQPICCTIYVCLAMIVSRGSVPMMGRFRLASWSQ